MLEKLLADHFPGLVESLQRKHRRQLTLGHQSFERELDVKELVSYLAHEGRRLTLHNRNALPLA